MSDLLPLAALGMAGAAWLIVLALHKPRLFLYLTFALAPTQFLFVPIRDFFLSPADVLVTVSLFAFILRATALHRDAWSALYQHRFMALMIVAYLAGFVVLGLFSRTIVRIPIGLTLSVLASELLRTREQLSRAATALVVAGAIDAGYGLFFVARGTPLHPSRFSGMSDVNFAAMSIVVAAAIAFAQLARSRRVARLLRPGALGALALATLSQMGVLALLSAWAAILRRIVSRRNKRRILAVATGVVVVALAWGPVRQRVLSRNERIAQVDGVARNSADIRLMLLRASWDAFRLSPVIGVGYFQFAAFSNRNPEIRASTGGAGYPTHNTYVEVLVEGGVIAFTFFLLHWAQYFKALLSAIRRAARTRDTLVAACLVGFPVVMVCAALANVLLVYSFWAVCGLALACLNLLRREEQGRRAAGVITGPSHFMSDPV